MHVEERRLEALEQVAADVEEPGAARPAQKLPPGPERMSQPISCTSIGSCPTDWQASSRNGTPAARVNRPTAAAGLTSPLWVGTCTSETSFTRSSRSPASASRSNWPCSSSGTTSIDAPVRVAHLAQRDAVRRVLGTAGQDAVSRGEAKRIERHVPGPGRVLDHRDLVAGGADQAGERVVGVLQPVVPLGRRLVAADLGFAAEMVDDGVDDRRSAEATSRRC